MDVSDLMDLFAHPALFHPGAGSSAGPARCRSCGRDGLLVRYVADLVRPHTTEAGTTARLYLDL